jgi:putative transposase
MDNYKHTRNCVGSNRKHIQLTTKYRYKMMKGDRLKTFCKIAIEEACKRHKIEIEIIKVMPEHVHMIVEIPRTICDAEAIQIIKGLSSYLLFRICEHLRKIFPKGHFWNEGYFCEGVGTSDFAASYEYIKNQDEHHCFS